eukprot:355608-Chlamydomonas_euryale.AAC.2
MASRLTACCGPTTRQLRTRSSRYASQSWSASARCVYAAEAGGDRASAPDFCVCISSVRQILPEHFFAAPVLAAWRQRSCQPSYSLLAFTWCPSPPHLTSHTQGFNANVLAYGQTGSGHGSHPQPHTPRSADPRLTSHTQGFYASVLAYGQTGSGHGSNPQPHTPRFSDPHLTSHTQGFNASVLAYGQTGSGKTYTMGMTCGEKEFMADKPKGVVPNTIRLLFTYLKKASEAYEITVKATVFRVGFEVWGYGEWELWGVGSMGSGVWGVGVGCALWGVGHGVPDLGCGLRGVELC